MAEENKNIDANNFLRLGRSLYDDFIIEGHLSLEEFVVLICLRFQANPHDGRVKISYEGLVQDFRGKFSKNFLTKILNGLKAKKYIYFRRRQGKSGSFLVYLNYYPLSNKRYTNIERMFLDDSPLQGEEREVAEAKAELVEGWHKFKEDIEAIDKSYYGSYQYTGRSINNENENKNENKNKKSPLGSENQAYTIRNENDNIEFEKQRCEEIATELNESSPALTLAYWARYGIEIVEEGYEVTLEANGNGKLENPGAFFNYTVRQLGEDKLQREGGESI